MIKRFVDKWSTSPYFFASTCVVCPIVVWILFFEAQLYVATVICAIIELALMLHYINFVAEAKVYYQVTLSKLDPDAVPNEIVKKHQTFTSTSKLKKLLRTKGRMRRWETFRFVRRLRKEQWATHFPKPSDMDRDAFMFVISYHKGILK